MRIPRSVSAILLVSIGVALAATAVGVALIRWPRSNAGAPQQGDRDGCGVPKAVVDQTPWELGVIESPDEFQHTFVIRNEGDASLRLAPGPSTCTCTLTEVPDTPIPPAGQARVRSSVKETAKKDPLKTGRLSRGIWLYTNDPAQDRIQLRIEATVVRRLAIEPTSLVPNFNHTVSASEKARSARALVYSQTWNRFDLAMAKTSLEGLKCRIEPAAKEKLASAEARSGYLVELTLPPDMPDGNFSEKIQFSAKPKDAGQTPRSLELAVNGRVEGRLSISGAKVDAGGILRLGLLEAGHSVRETLVMKVNDDCRSLAVKQIETKPEMLRVRVAPFQAGSDRIGLYRVEVEVRDARPGSFTGTNVGTVRLKTDHPRLRVIDLKVDFSVTSKGADVAAR